MSTRPHSENQSLAATGLPVEKPLPGNIPYQSLAILFALILTGCGLIFLPKATPYYPHLIVDVPEGIQLDVLLHARKDRAECEKAATNIAEVISASCRTCSTRLQICLENLPAELKNRFDENPLPVHSTRMANGIITYSAPQSAVALAVCQQSERQAALKGRNAKMVCYAAGSMRPKTLFEKSQEQAAHTTFTLLLAGIGALMTGLTILVFGAYLTHRQQTVQSAFSNSSIPLIPNHPWVEKLTLAGIDTLILLGTFLALAWPDADNINHWSRLDQSSVIGHGVAIILTVGWFWLLLEHYARRRPFWDELREILRVLVIMFMLASAIVFTAGLEVARSTHFAVWALNLLLIPLGRQGARLVLHDLGLWERPAIIVGTGKNARDAFLALRNERSMGCRIFGFVKSADDSGNSQTLKIGEETYPLITQDQAGNFPMQLEVFIATDTQVTQSEQLLIQTQISRGNTMHIIPALRGLPLHGTQISHFFKHEVLLLTLRNNLARRGYKLLKRGFDLITATLLILFLSPLLLWLVYQIRRDGGSAIYSHARIGKGGKVFKCLKFRSMRSDAEKALQDLLAKDESARQEWARNFKLKDDPRITPVGQWLRKTSLDELPQLINVLRGEMSLVGPRPIVEAELERYGNYANLYLQALPGMTGLWQVSGRNDTGYEERVALDAWYVQNWSLWYDVAILFKTIDVVLNRRGAY